MKAPLAKEGLEKESRWGRDLSSDQRRRRRRRRRRLLFHFGRLAGGFGGCPEKEQLFFRAQGCARFRFRNRGDVVSECFFCRKIRREEKEYIKVFLGKFSSFHSFRRRDSRNFACEGNLILLPCPQQRYLSHSHALSLLKNPFNLPLSAGWAYCERGLEKKIAVSPLYLRRCVKRGNKS